MASSEHDRKSLGRVRVLDRDPGLADCLSNEDLEEARRVLIAPCGILPPGDWRPCAKGVPDNHSLGLLVLDGLITRQVSVGGAVSAELVGPGDLISPGDGFGSDAPQPLHVDWRVLEESRVVVLGENFAGTAARWPALTAALVARVTRRAQTLALLQAIGAAKGVELRLTMLFWHFAGRWGRVRSDGVLIPLPLTHETLGRLVGARRPSVSTALKSLERQQSLTCERGHGWLLKPTPGQNGELWGPVPSLEPEIALAA